MVNSKKSDLNQIKQTETKFKFELKTNSTNITQIISEIKELNVKIKDIIVNSMVKQLFELTAKPKHNSLYQIYYQDIEDKLIIPKMTSEKMDSKSDFPEYENDSEIISLNNFATRNVDTPFVDPETENQVRELKSRCNSWYRKSCEIYEADRENK